MKIKDELGLSRGGVKNKSNEACIAWRIIHGFQLFCCVCTGKYSRVVPYVVPGTGNIHDNTIDKNMVFLL